jgi:hypothetical protein
MEHLNAWQRTHYKEVTGAETIPHQTVSARTIWSAHAGALVRLAGARHTTSEGNRQGQWAMPAVPEPEQLREDTVSQQGCTTEIHLGEYLLCTLLWTTMQSAEFILLLVA